MASTKVRIEKNMHYKREENHLKGKNRIYFLWFSITKAFFSQLSSMNLDATQWQKFWYKWKLHIQIFIQPI